MFFWKQHRQQQMNHYIIIVTDIEPPETPFTPTKSLSKRFESNFSIA